LQSKIHYHIKTVARFTMEKLIWKYTWFSKLCFWQRWYWI